MMLMYLGMGEYDWETFERTPVSDKIYAQDAEVFNIEEMYTEFLEGVDYIIPDAEFTDIREDLSGLTVRWLQNDVSAFICCTVVNLWLALPFMIMIMDGGLKSIDRSYYESATLDGAGPIRQAISITLPCLKPIIGPSVMITLFTTFKQFDVIYLMTQQVGSQTGAHIHTIITYAYENAFITNNYGYSSAISIMIFVLLIVFAQVTNRRSKEANA